MNEKRSFGAKAEAFFAGKGFYIALFGCLAIIGISAWVLLFSDYLKPKTVEDDFTSVMAELKEEEPVITDTENEFSETELIVPKEDTVTETIEPEITAIPDIPEETVSDLAEAESEVETVRQLIFTRPINGEMTAAYSPDELVYSKTMSDWRTHAGVDLAGEVGAKVMAVADGRVERVFEDALYGTTVVIDHGEGLESIYSNLAKTPTVNEGDAVTMGSVIGSVGETAIAEADEVSHIHFAMRQDGELIDPDDKLPGK